MKKTSFLPFLFLLLLSACQSQEIPAPKTQVECSLDYSNHPRHQALSQLLDQFTDSSFVGLSLLVDHPQEGLWIGSSGWADIENKIRMTPCHLHHAASIHKSYTAVVILQLAEEGKIDLDDPLGNYLSDEVLAPLPNGRAFTIRQLLQCRSGMPDTFESDFLLDFLNHPIRQYSMEELMRYLHSVDPVGEPGGRFYYGDGNFILLSMLIESLEGDLVEVFKQRIFAPLGAGDSHLLDTPADAPDGLAASYWDRYGNGVVENVSDYQLALSAGLEGTDGLVTSVYDLNLFQRGLLDGTLLSAASYAEMVDVLDIPEGDSDQNYAAYGLGIARVQLTGEIWYGSFGNHVGSSSMMLYNPARDLSIVAVQNTGTFFNDEMKAAFFGYLLVAIESVAI